MDTNPIHIAHIVAKCSKKEQLLPSEQYILEKWLSSHPKNKVLFDELMSLDPSGKEFSAHFDEEKAWRHVIARHRRNKLIPIWRVAAAVCIGLLGTYSLFTTLNLSHVEKQIAASEIMMDKADVSPAFLGAKVVLASGKEIQVNDTLNIALNNVIAEENPTAGEIGENEPVVHTLIVPKANFFKLTLSDGTNVWVNAASELRFPEHFGPTERRVSLKGEAYFEVAKETDRPFFVDTEEQRIRVLGTHFNVSAYNKKVKTSLASGSVEVFHEGQSAVIKPGQSAESGIGGIKVETTDLQRDLAWKNNIFYFKNDNIVRIAGQLQRWYDLDVSFSKDVSLEKTYTGEIGRNVNLSEVLTMLTFVSDLKFTWNANKLLITKKEK